MGLYILNFGCNPVAAQQSGLEQLVTIHIKNLTFSDALAALEDYTGYTFSYSSDLINKKRRVDLNYDRAPLRKVLDDLFEKKIGHLRLQGRNISIKTEDRKKLKTGLLKGKVRSRTGEVLIGAYVVVKGTQNGAIADVEGSYEIAALDPGTYILEASSVGFLSESKTAILREGASATLDFDLEEDKQQLDEVMVTGKTELTEVKESGFQVSAIDAQKYANTNTDINQILNRTTGIRIRESGGLGSDFTFAINGLSGRYVRFFIDGVPMENLGQAFNLNNFPANLVERIEVYKGVVPGALGSDALGGAVNIVTNRQIKHFVDASYSYGSFDTHRSALTSQYKDTKTGITVLLKGFYNYSANNYKMRNDPEHNVLIEVAENGKWVAKDGLRRFYDRYKSGMGQLEVGVADKKWADKLLVGVSYAGYNKQLQTGAVLSTVNGGRYIKGSTLSPSVSYTKADFLTKGLSVTLSTSIGYDQYSVRDTASYPYDWSGNFIQPLPIYKNNPYGYQYINKSLLGRANLDYALSTRHTLSINYNANIMKRHNVNELDPEDPYLGPDNHLQKHIAALSLNSTLFDSRLSNNLFVKYLGVNASKNILTKEEFVRDDDGNYKWTPTYDQKRDYSNYYGYGMATRYKITTRWGIKTSVEKAYRLLDGNDLFGDGLYYLGNEDLKPESSYNYNLGVFYNSHQYKHRFSFDASIFYRDAHDFIYTRILKKTDPKTLQLADYTQPYNAGNVQISGIETEFKYQYDSYLNIGVNASYQNAIDNRRYNDGVTAYESITYKNRIPNQPWLFGNIDIGAGKDELLGKKTRLQLDWYTQYVNWFYLSWEGLGSKESKNRIPTQLVHNASVTASWFNGKYNLSIESRNLNNEIVYDNFRLQKAGRAFYVKLRCLIK